MGGNLAYEGIARLTNGLVPLLKENPMPSSAELTEVFNQYIAGQMPRAKTVVDVSGSITRYEAEESWHLKFAARHIVPWVSDRLKAKLYASFSRGGPWLEFLPLPARDANMAKSTGKSGPGISTVMISGTVIAGAVAAFWKASQ